MLVGTTRHPLTVRLRASISAFRVLRACSASAESRFRNTMPVAKFLPSSKPASSAFARRKLTGLRSNKPQPSPDLPSAATAPRCVMRPSASTAVLTSLWDGLPSIWAMSPNPQLSCSNSGRYRPFAASLSSAFMYTLNFSASGGFYSCDGSAGAGSRL